MAAEETSETDAGKQRTPLTMIIPPAVLVAAALVDRPHPRLGPVVQAAAVRFQDQAGYNATVLAGAHVAHPVALVAAEPSRHHAVRRAGRRRLGGRRGGPGLARAVLAPPAAAAPRLRTGRRADRADPRFQSGVVNDYVTWIVLGLAGLGGALALIIR